MYCEQRAAEAAALMNSSAATDRALEVSADVTRWMTVPTETMRATAVSVFTV